MKYNYVILWTDWDLYKQSFADVIGKDNVRYISNPRNSLTGIKKRIFDFQINHYRINKLIDLLTFGLWLRYDRWFPYYFKNDFNNTNPIIFIMNRMWANWIFDGYPQYLKKNYKDSKTVHFLCDIISSMPFYDIKKEKKDYDLTLSFDQGDCKKYDFIYHPLVFSPFKGKIVDMPCYDVYFLGQAKNRLPELIACFEKLWKFGVSTDLYLIGVKEEERVYTDRIHYIDTMPYHENLQHTLHAKCELEIMQQGGTGFTQRMCEVIALDKKIITNNPLIHKAPFYNPDYIFQINSSEDITEEICCKIKEDTPVDYHYKEKLSPIELIEFIEKRL